MSSNRISISGGGRTLILLFILLATGIIAGGYFAYGNYARHFRAVAENDLSVIANLKVADLAQWRQERLADAEPFRLPAFTAVAQRFFANPHDADAKQSLQTWIANYPSRRIYTCVFLTDTQGVTQVSVAEAPPTRVPLRDPDAIAALRSRQAILGDLRRDTPDSPIHMSVLIPICNERDDSQPQGVLVLRINPDVYLYPFIRHWPSPSRTAETLLVRKEGNEVVFLNELRFRKNTALRLRLSLQDLGLPAARAALGQDSVVEGIDYRGKAMVAALCTIPDSPWALVARMDAAEVYAPMRRQLWLIVILIGALLIAAAGGVTLAWWRQRIRIYKERLTATDVLRASEIRYRRLFEAAKDGVLILDAETGMITDVNPFLIRLLGYSREAFLGKKLWELGSFANVGANRDYFAELLQKEYVRYEDMALEACDGTRHEVEFISNVYQANHHKTIQCNIRDITARKQTETYFKLSHETLQILNKPTVFQQAIQQVLGVWKTQTGIDAVGVRLQNGDDFPYFAQQGFSADFLQTENSLLARAADGGVCRSADGQACLTCICGLVLSGKTDPTHALCTPGGSFWTNNAAALAPGEFSLLSPRNQCVQQGYASLALIPIRNKGRIAGLIHLAARRKGCFNLDGINLWEDMASHIGEAMMRMQSEDALRKSKEMFRALIGGMPDIVARFDCAGRHLFASENVRNAFDLDAVQLIGKTHRELGFPVAQCQFWEDAIRRALDSGVPIETEITLGRHGPKVYNCRFIPERNAQGKMQSVLMISRDITEHRQAEKNYQMLFREMLNGFALHEIICDQQGNPVDYRFLDVNPAFERMTGLQAKDIVGKTALEVLPDTEKRWIDTYGKVALTGEPVSFENYHAGLNKHFTVAAIRPAPSRFACIFDDITARKRMEAEQEKANQDLRQALHALQNMQAQMLQQARMNTLGQLASGIAHDFNNILMPILGYSELLLADPAALDNRDEALEAIRRINRAAGDARQITRRLRLIYRPDDMALYVPVDMNEIIREALAMTQPHWDTELGAKGILIHAATRLEACALALGDASQLREAVMNLILNAVDAMPHGGDLTLSTHLEHPNVVLCVTDTGTGMTDEVKARCLDAFFTTKSHSKGSGLGLTIVAGIVSQHQGTLEFDSAPGRGTTIRLRVPCAPTGATTAKPDRKDAEKHATPTSLRILLAEDDVEVLNLLDQVLKGAGHTIEKTRNGSEAIAKVRSGAFDLVITDRSMPGANGDEVALAAQAHTPDTPVILLSGFGYLMNIKGERPPGVTRVFGKPISPQDLLRVIQEVVADRRKNPV